MDFTKLSELLVIDSIDCGANEEFIELIGLGGGGVGDLRGEIAETGEDGRRSPGFGDAGRTNGSGFDTMSAVEGADVAAEAAAGAVTFNGGGGIIPLPWSIRATMGRDTDISAPSLTGAGVRRLMTFATPDFCLSIAKKDVESSHQ